MSASMTDLVFLVRGWEWDKTNWWYLNSIWIYLSIFWYISLHFKCKNRNNHVCSIFSSIIWGVKRGYIFIRYSVVEVVLLRKYIGGGANILFMHIVDEVWSSLALTFKWLRCYYVPVIKYFFFQIFQFDHIISKLTFYGKIKTLPIYCIIWTASLKTCEICPT